MTVMCVAMLLLLLVFVEAMWWNIMDPPWEKRCEQGAPSASSTFPFPRPRSSASSSSSRSDDPSLYGDSGGDGSSCCSGAQVCESETGGECL